MIFKKRIIDDLNEILSKHLLWLQGSPEGKRADLRGSDLSDANLSDANLRNADLSGADLGGADLSGADLSDANLFNIKRDFFQKLSLAKQEVTYLYKSLTEGKINGTAYEGDCACFVGTISKAQGLNNYKDCKVLPDSNSLTEIFFFAIKSGDTPKTNPISLIIKQWIEEFCLNEGVKLNELSRT